MARNKNRRRSITALLTILLILASAVFIWSGYEMFVRSQEYKASREEYSGLQAQFKKPSTTQNSENATQDGGENSADAGENDNQSGKTDFASPVDFASLRAINPEVIGWVEVTGTDINYPIVQTSDNDKYLSTAFSGESNRSGAIFADKLSKSDLMGAHNIIYGHNMKDGSMFAKLVNFKDADFFADHDEIMLYTPERTLRLTVIAAYAQKANSELRTFDFADKNALSDFIDSCVKNSANLRTGVDYSDADRLYSFVTCSYEADDVRTVVHAVELPFGQ